MRLLTLSSMVLLASLGASSSVLAQHHHRPRTRIVVSYPYHYGPYYAPYYASTFGDPYPYYRLTPHYRDPYQTSGVRLKVHPNDASVFVDGYYAGTVDDFDGTFQQLDVKPGPREITVKRSGYRTHTFRVYAAPARSIKLAYELEKGSGPDGSEGTGDK